MPFLEAPKKYNRSLEKEVITRSVIVFKPSSEVNISI